MLKVNHIHPFLQGFFLLTQLADRADMKLSPTMLYLKVSNFSPHFFVAALQFSPQFFTFFSFDHTHCSRIPIHRLYHLIVDMTQRKFSSMAIFLDEEQNRLALQFYSSGQSGQVLFHHLMLSSPVENDMGQIDPRAYVSIDSQDFRHIVQQFEPGLVRVALTHSQVKFSDANTEFIFIKEEDECIIDGVTPGDEIEFLITLHPVEFFHKMAYNARRVWLHKTTNSGSILVIPVGHFAKSMIYFPPRSHGKKPSSLQKC